jgi:hypothetical protein
MALAIRSWTVSAGSLRIALDQAALAGRLTRFQRIPMRIFSSSPRPSPAGGRGTM